MTTGIRHIAILGLGLIGGSLASVWKQRRPVLTITGYDGPDVLEMAIEMGLIDRAATTLNAAVAGADLVVLAAPMSTNMRLLSDLAPMLAPGVLVTDVGSVKGPIVRHAGAVLPEVNPFLGGHPMAGSEHSGVGHADAFLFENATYVVCPPEAGLPLLDLYPDFFDLLSVTGARVLLLEADRHDRIAAAVSHLPQLLAVSLMNYAAGEHETDPFFLQLAAGGFRDLTRIASSPFTIWRDIFPANHGALLDALARFMARLQQTRNRLIEEDWDTLEADFTRARHVRDTIPGNTKGFLHPLVDIFVSVVDKPGALHQITGALYSDGLSLKDIELLKIREGTGGTFRLGFTGIAEADRAVSVLREAGLDAYRL